MKTYVFIAASILLSSCAQIMMKLGATRVGHNAYGLGRTILDYLLNAPLIAGLCLYAASAVLWIIALAKVPLSLAYPMVALSYVIVAILSHFVFSEAISALRMIGLAFIVVGVVLIARS